MVRRERTRNGHDVTVRRYRLFSDRSRAELLRLPVPDPPDSFRLLRGCIPAWTGLETRAESVMR